MSKQVIPSKTDKAVSVEGTMTPKQALTVLTDSYKVLEAMAGIQSRQVYKDFGEQVEGWRSGRLDMSKLRVSDKNHQAITKHIRGTERMIEFLKNSVIIDTTATKEEPKPETVPA